MECHKVDRVTGAGENGKVEWPVAVTEECLMQPTKPARNTKATAQNFGTTSSTRWAGSSLCLAAASEIRASSPNKFAVFLEKSLRMQEGDIVALTNEPA